MPSATYRVFREAILGEKQVTCIYKGRRRELCPHVLGYKDKQEKVLAFQFGGETNSRLPPGGEWRCLAITEVRDARLRDGPWHEDGRHARQQSCIDIVDLDVNIHVRKPR